ncbi:hypothetical protein CCR82_09905 [Halochromatium salexigens]|uniref:FimV N-terminal domain-containing protein n=1 Tax=Halochromatium salexigens TaxID=49447 RepID=A0AAJ0XGN6_HALSE|nr:hypothetical protein [Halochromatium salexigens]
MLAVFLLLPAARVPALDVGELRTRSALNQPFHGEIDLLDVNESDLDQVEARLARPAAFEQAGLERPAFLTELRFTPMIGPKGGPIIQVISRAPIREPYLVLLLELLWPGGRLVKDYAVLLDPPAVSSPRAERATGVLERDFPLRYGPVPAGVGLTEVGRRLAMPGATLEQLALAFHRNSPGAFVDGNINRLRQGAELIIPTRAELLALDPEAAREQYWAAAAGARIAQVPLTDVDARLTDASQETTGRTGARVARTEQPPVEAAGPALAPEVGADEAALVPEPGTEDKAPAPAVGAKGLAPTPESESGASMALLEAELLLMREQSEANRQEATELRARVQELEARLSTIRRLLERRNAQLANLANTNLVAEVEPMPPKPEAAFEQQSADAADDGSHPAEQASGLDPSTTLAAGRNAMPGWALPLVAVVLLLTLLGFVLHRRRKQEESAVMLDSAVTREALDPTGQDEELSLELDELEPMTDAASAESSESRLETIAAGNDRPKDDAEEDDSLIAMPVVEVNDVATEDVPETRWHLERDGDGR